MIEQDEREHWVRSGHAMFAEFMQRVQTIDRIGAKGMDASSDEKRVTLIDKRKVYATLDEIADLYVSDEKMVLDFTESRALAVFHTPSPAHPMEYIGFRWSYYKTPSRLVRSQDFFYLETMKPFVDVYGRRGWAKCSHSIEHPMCPDNSTSRGINRGRLFYSGVVFVESRERGVLETTFYYSLDTTSIPAFLLPVVMKQRGKNNAALINHYVKVARMSAYAEKTNVKKLKQQLVEEKRCGACSNPIPKWSSKTKCLFCKSYVCKRCVEIVSKNYLFDGETHCNSCMLCAESHGSKIASLMDDDASSTTTDETESRRGATGTFLEECGTPSFIASSDHTSQTFSSKSRPDRCMSMPASTSRVPPKLIDFGLEGIDLALRRHEAPAAAARSHLSTASTVSSNASGSAPSSHGRAASVSSSVRKESAFLETVATSQKGISRERSASSRRHHIDRSLDSPHQIHPHQSGVAPSPASLRHQRLRHQRRSEDEPTRIRKDTSIAYTRENLCDLSYLSSFKV